MIGFHPHHGSPQRNLKPRCASLSPGLLLRCSVFRLRLNCLFCGWGDEVRAVPWAILAVGFAVIIGLGVLGGPLGFFASAIAGGIFALVLNAWYQWRHPV